MTELEKQIEQSVAFLRKRSTVEKQIAHNYLEVGNQMGDVRAKNAEQYTKAADLLEYFKNGFL